MVLVDHDEDRIRIVYGNHLLPIIDEGPGGWQIDFLETSEHFTVGHIECCQIAICTNWTKKQKRGVSSIPLLEITMAYLNPAFHIIQRQCLDV